MRRRRAAAAAVAVGGVFWAAVSWETASACVSSSRSGGIFPLAPRPRVSQVFLLPSRVKVVQLCGIMQRRRSLNFSSTSSSSSSSTSSFSYLSSSSSSLLLDEAASCLDHVGRCVSNTCERVKASSDHRGDTVSHTRIDGFHFFLFPRPLFFVLPICY